MNKKHISIITFLIVLGLFFTFVSADNPVKDPVFTEVSPYSGEGLTKESARDKNYEFEVFSETAEDCKVDVIVYNYTDFEKGDNLYDYQEITPCKEFNRTETTTSIWESVDKKKGDYYVNFTLSRYNGTEYLKEDQIDHNFRIGSIIDTFAGMLKLPYDIFRIIAGTVITLFVTGGLLKETESGMVGAIGLISSIIVFIYLDWFTNFYIFILITLIGISTYFINKKP